MIAVVGSLNMDFSVEVPHLPAPGETVLGGASQSSLGGKGANQAIAAARAGGHVRLLACIGDDPHGRSALNELADEGIETSSVFHSTLPTGIALIGVATTGENSIMIAPGANADLSPERLTAEHIAGTRVLVTQLEIPLASVQAAIKLGRSVGATVVTNASPVHVGLTAGDLKGTDLLVVNEIEAAQLLGNNRNTALADERLAVMQCRQLRKVFPRVVITLGARGAVWADKHISGYAPGFVVRAVDTTGAGDAFTGALAAALERGLSLADAVRIANAAGALATQTRGAATAPSTEELERFLRQAKEVSR